MSFKITPNTLKKMEHIFQECGYVIRYEKGTFNSGYCLLEAKKVVVVNKFLDLEGRINSLADILPQIDYQNASLDAADITFLNDLQGRQNTTQSTLDLES